jgi:GH25 family lysozyme M1 (1,4-beta-N-acetylmuramidase)
MRTTTRPVRGRRLASALGLSAALSTALLLTALATVPAEAAPTASTAPSWGSTLPDNPASDPALYRYIQQNDHPAGSQVAKHEGSRNATITPSTITPYTVVYGMDVSGYQGNVDWQTAYNNGARFAYVKATEGTGYTNPYFAQQYEGSYYTGFIRGAYHFARPDVSGGATQAAYFLAHGGGWSADGQTLPGALDIEWNPYGGTCYGYSQAGMTQWILDFSNYYHGQTGRWPVIYTATSWWSQCVGYSDFSSTNPLWVARYASSAGTLPYNWGYYTIWQYADSGTFPGDQDLFNGAYDRLQALATG